jgi:hypothetical protein
MLPPNVLAHPLLARPPGLWSQFCGFSRDKLSKEPYWALQLCNASTIDSIVADTLKQDNAAEVCVCVRWGC